MCQLCCFFFLFGEASCRTVSAISSSSYVGRLQGVLFPNVPHFASQSDAAPEKLSIAKSDLGVAVQDFKQPSARPLVASFMSKSAGVPTNEQRQLLDVLPSWWFSAPTTTTAPETTQDRMDTLYKSLVTGDYQRDVRPLHNCGDAIGCSEPLPVQVGLKFVKFLDLDEKSSVLSVQVIFSLMWPDERLDYDTATHPALSPWDYEEDAIPIAVSKLWVPDIQLANAAAQTEKIFTMAEPKAFVYNVEKRRRDGFNVRIRQPAVMRIKCKLDLDEFPFDSQSCKFVFRPWSSNTKWINLLPARGDQFEPSELSEKSAEFRVTKITDLESRFDQDELGDGAEHFTQVEYILDLQRHLHFYMARIILPMIMIVVLSAGLFYMKLGDSRVVVGVTLVLTVMSVSSFSAELLPKAGGEDTWIERFQSDCYLAVMTPLFASLFLLLLQRVLVEDNRLGTESGVRFARCVRATDAVFRLAFILYVIWFTYRMFAIQAVSESKEPSVYWVRFYLVVVIALMTALALLEVFWCALGGHQGGDGEAATSKSVSFVSDVGDQRSADKRRGSSNRKSSMARGRQSGHEPGDGPGGGASGEEEVYDDDIEENSNSEADDVGAQSPVAVSSRASLPVTSGHVKRLKDNFASP